MLSLPLQGAFWGLLVGLTAGIVRLIVVFVYKHGGECGEVDNRPTFLTDLHYMYYAMILFCLTLIVTVVWSLFTEKPLPEQVIVQIVM